MIKLIFKLENIHCVGCANRVKNALISAGALHVDVDFSSKTAHALVHHFEHGDTTYTSAIEKSGYETQLIAVLDEVAED